MVDFPQHLRVGAVVYRLCELDYQEAIVQDIDGDCDTTRRVIRVREDMNRDDKARVLLHEVMHAAFNSGDLHGTEGEEKIVVVLANQMTQIWRDNPDFVSFMNDALSVDFG